MCGNWNLKGFFLISVKLGLNYVSSGGHLSNFITWSEVRFQKSRFQISTISIKFIIVITINCFRARVEPIGFSVVFYMV